GPGLGLTARNLEDRSGSWVRSGREQLQQILHNSGNQSRIVVGLKSTDLSARLTTTSSSSRLPFIHAKILCRPLRQHSELSNHRRCVAPPRCEIERDLDLPGALETTKDDALDIHSLY